MAYPAQDSFQNSVKLSSILSLLAGYPHVFHRNLKVLSGGCLPPVPALRASQLDEYAEYPFGPISKDERDARVGR